MIEKDKQGITIIVVFFIAIGLFYTSLYFTNEREIKTAENINIEKYDGLWYSLYELPNGFQKNCNCVTAKYDIINKTTISVLNTCGNTGKNISGFATVVNSTTNAELKVDFGYFRSGDYNILYVDDYYKYAIVGSKDRKYLWFLGRNTEISDIQLNVMKKIAIEQEYNTIDMIKVKHDCK